MATIQQKLLLENNNDLKLKIRYALTTTCQAIVKEVNPFDQGNVNAVSYFQKRTSKASVLLSNKTAMSEAVNTILQIIIEDVSFTVNTDTVSLDVSETEATLFDKIFGTVTASSTQQQSFGKSPATDYNYIPGSFDTLIGFKNDEYPEVYTGTTIEESGRFYVLVNGDGVSLWNSSLAQWVDPAVTDYDRFVTFDDAAVVRDGAAGAGDMFEVRKTYPQWWYDSNALVFKNKLS